MDKETKENSEIENPEINGNDGTDKSINSIISKFMNGSADDRNDGGQSSAQIESVPEKIEGDQHKYQLGEQLAEGGMGSILTARDLHIKRDVAMKVLLEKKRKKEDNIVRFIEEAQVTGQLEHPGIVPVYELGVNEVGEVFYTMKYIEGVTLKEIIRNIKKNDPATIIKYPLSTLLNIVQKVCDAVAYAHHKGVIHRDLKPENIMIGSFGEVSVMDWGLAKTTADSEIQGLTTIRTEMASIEEPRKKHINDFVEAKASITEISSLSDSEEIDSLILEEDGESLRTMDGQILGTPNYMAPEQAMGQNDEINYLTDVYALGGLLYSILTLGVPITGKTFYRNDGEYCPWKYYSSIFICPS